jgi:two-component system, OmpR family, phosphate regulon sensor histidine kinase PhoR
MHSRGLPIRRQLLAVAGLLCLMVLGITAAGLVAVNAEEWQAAELAEATGPAMSLNSAVLQTMTDSESGLRGYTASGDPALLARFNQRRARAEQDQLSALLASRQFSAADRETYQRQQAAQAAAIARWWRYAAAARASGTRVQAADLIAGEAIFGRIRAANAALAASLNANQAALRAQAGRTLVNGVAALIVTTLLVMLTGLVAAARISGTVASPLIQLRRAVQRQRQGDVSARAGEDRGPAEVRSLAIASNELVAEQAEAARLQKAIVGAGQAIRCATSAGEAMAITCSQVGAVLGARRVIAVTRDTASKITADAEWHAPGLEDLPGIAAVATAGLPRSGDQAPNSAAPLVVSDLLSGETAEQDWALRLRQDTGATALIMVPVGLGSQASGVLCVITDTGPRQWTPAEADTAEKLAGYLGTAITQVADEARRAEYTTRLELLDRQKTEFLSTVSHELRTPLTSIQGYLELLADGDAGPMTDEQRQMLAVIERNAVRLRGLIEDILVLNRIESGAVIASFSEVTLAGLTASIAEELAPMAAKAGVRLRTRIDTGPARIRGDEGQLRRAVVNIVSNAIKFSTRDSVVRLSCTTDPVAGEVLIMCQDTGMGIPDADHAHLFTRFFRGSNAIRQAIPGTGLGLAIVAAIVEGHDGRLTVDSTEGKGTTITMHFPQGRSAASARAVADSRRG